eukprot:1765300-Pleurochrysis_carterae.AAC.1
MDDTLATTTPSARLEPVHTLSQAMLEAPDVGAGKAARRKAEQLHAGKEVPGSKAHLVCYGGDVACIGNLDVKYLFCVFNLDSNTRLNTHIHFGHGRNLT